MGRKLILAGMTLLLFWLGEMRERLFCRFWVSQTEGVAE
jgi:hypothetical protein